LRRSKRTAIDTFGIEIRDTKGKEETGKISDSAGYARATLALHADDPSPNVEILERVERLERNYSVLRRFLEVMIAGVEAISCLGQTMSSRIRRYRFTTGWRFLRPLSVHGRSRTNTLRPAPFLAKTL
jgi:hypothetical protein